jgi:cation diffusion facilitator CzcD-associated flavoprotein CzcO
VTPSIAIMGAGFSGLAMALALERAGIRSYTLYEKADRLGGTWRDNHYPGAACDTPAHLYSFSFAPNPDWSRTFATQPEILAYLEACARRHGVDGRIRFGVEIAGGAFDDDAGVWRLTTTRGETIVAQVVVSACGQLNRPAYPSIPGRFAGPQFHSARWDHTVALDGRRVAVIGTGASAIQFVPEVAARASHLTLFQRSPPWIAPKADRRYSRLERTLFRRVPALRVLHRARLYARNESRFLLLRKGSLANRLAQRLAGLHLERTVRDPGLRARLQPEYALGCKRILISNDYLPALARPNVTVVGEAIAELRPDGVVVDGGGFHPADVLIYGTGFQATDFLAPMRLVGRGGRELNQAWKDGAEAYLGISVPGFPNLFLLYGPNTNLGHNSIVFMVESQVRYVLGCVRALRSARWMDLKPERLARYADELRVRLATLVWDDGCTSWYLNASGRNTNNWPGPSFEYRRRTWRVNLDDFERG